MAELQSTANASTSPTGASVLYQNLSAMPVIKQVSLIIALAAPIAIGVALFTIIETEKQIRLAFKRMKGTGQPV